MLLFRKGGRTERVLFLHADADGYKLDANHDTPIEADDLPGLIEAYHGRIGGWAEWQQRDPEEPWPREVVVRDHGRAARGRLQPLGLALAPAGEGAGRAPRPAGAAG